MNNDQIKNVSYLAVAASAVVASSVYVYSAIIRDNKVPVEKEKTTQVVYVTATPAPTHASKYKDGEYTAKGDYLTNNGAASHKMDVTLSLEKDVIKAASTELKDANLSDAAKTSNKKFNDELKTVVVGKKIDEVAAIGKISGSSDTTKGFKEAVELIKAQAVY